MSNDILDRPGFTEKLAELEAIAQLSTLTDRVAGVLRVLTIGEFTDAEREMAVKILHANATIMTDTKERQGHRIENPVFAAEMAARRVLEWLLGVRHPLYINKVLPLAFDKARAGL